jgi:thymidine phosphorylase
MLVLGQAAATQEEARKRAQQALRDGTAWGRFLDLVKAQGGDIDYVINPERLPRAPIIETVPSPESGYLKQIHARKVGETAVVLGAGREKKGDQINHAVGIEILREVGDKIKKGDDLFILHAANQTSFDKAKEQLLQAHQWSDSAVKPLPLVYDIVS